jgi:hypothetical protein
VAWSGFQDLILVLACQGLKQSELLLIVRTNVQEGRGDLPQVFAIDFGRSQRMLYYNHFENQKFWKQIWHR